MASVAVLLHVLMVTLAAGSDCVSGHSSCPASTQHRSDQSSLLQGVTKVVHGDASEQKPAGLVSDAMHMLHKIVKDIEAGSQAEEATRYPLAALGEMDSFVSLGSHEGDGFLSLEAHKSPVTIFQDSLRGGIQHHKALVVVAVVMCIMLMTLLPQLGPTVLLNMFLFCLFVVWSSSMLLVNKSLIHDTHVQPVVLVSLHMLASAIAMRGLYYSMPQYFPGLTEMEKMPSDQRSEVWRSVAMIAVCFGASLICDNSAYLYSSVPFLQMIKESGILVVAGLTLAMGLDTVSPQRWGLLALVVVGGCMCVRGEVHLSFAGPSMQMLSNICNSMRLALQSKLMIGVKLDPLSYVALVSPVCLGVLLLPVVAVVLINHDVLIAIRLSIGTIMLSCMLAVGINLLVAVLVKRVAALGYCLMGSIKTAIFICFSCYVLGIETTRCQVLGCSLILASSTVYTVLKHWEKQGPANETSMETTMSPGLKAGLATTSDAPKTTESTYS